MGINRTFFNYRPQPTSIPNALEWYDAAGAPERSLQVVSPVGNFFVWADAGAGRVVATGTLGLLARYLPDGSVDPTFTSPGRVASVLALEDGKLLVDGTRRLLADGQPDPAWNTPVLTAPAQVSSIVRLADGRMLVAGGISTAGGSPASDLAVLHADGSVDTSFQADARVFRPRSVTVSGNAVYAVMSYPVRLQDGGLTTRIKLGMDGVMDENFNPEPATRLYIRRFDRVFPQPDGTLLAEGTGGYDVTSTHLFRLDAAGAVLHRFIQPSVRYAEPAVALPAGGIVQGGTLYSVHGTVTAAVGGRAKIHPVCQWQGGILFTEETGGTPQMQRLRLWKAGRWVPGFAAPPIPSSTGLIQAAEGPEGSLYIRAGWGDGTQTLRRLLADGNPDTTFTALAFTHLHRREVAAWKVAGAAGLEDYDPAVATRTLHPAAWVHDPASGGLWVGGDFNQVSGVGRDGLARLEGGTVPPPGPARTAYASWALGMRLEDSGPQDDLDGDGVPNVLEFLYGTDPREVSAGTTATVNETSFIFSYDLSREAMDAIRTVEYSEDLENWEVADEETEAFSEEPVTGDIIRISLTMSRAGRDRLFFRLRASVP
jgi:hypothetical protein